MLVCLTCFAAVICVQASRYNIGGYDYVLDDLENGILRGNSPAASTIGMLLKLPWLSKGPFKGGDPRAQHVSGDFSLHRSRMPSCALLLSACAYVACPHNAPRYALK
jgi:hypothetical protein